eukprot:m.279852 g.279852  ORF g.279852 m.279852 type:complete len:200 (+) comp40627_c0_seq9:1879-2478(+)
MSDTNIQILRDNKRTHSFGGRGTLIDYEYVIENSVHYEFSGADYYPGSKELTNPDAVRTFFPETWIWLNTTTGDSGVAVVSEVVPDTITSWVASAFALNAQTGLGVSDSNAMLIVFKPFFVSLNLPYSVVRGEQLGLQVVVFNYLKKPLNVVVKLETKSGLAGIFGLPRIPTEQFLTIFWCHQMMQSPSLLLLFPLSLG